MDAGPKRNLKLRYTLMAAAIVVVILGWSGGWFYLRGQLDQRIETALKASSGTGASVACARRQIAGFPFRFEVTCTRPVATTPSGATVLLNRLEAVALVYNPWHIIFDAIGPAQGQDLATGAALTANWTSARSSLLLSNSGARQIDVVFNDFDLNSANTGLGRLLAQHLEFHARPVPETRDTVEGFVSAQSLKTHQLNGLPGPIDGRLHLRLANGLGLLSGRPLNALPRAEDGSLPFELVWLSLSSGETELTATGQLKLTPAGRLSGKLDLGIRGIDNAKALLAGLFPQGSPAPESLTGAAIALGQPKTDREGRHFIELPLTLEEGAVRVGVVPLGITLPPLMASLWQAGS